jgi:helicase
MYIQMAGRAGRPGLETEGYSYIVTKNAVEKEYIAPRYMEGKIERAISRIGHDEYFRKAILELVYSRRSTNKEILKFFENTFYNFQSKAEQNPFLPFCLFDIIKSHIMYLNNSGLIVPLGAPGYQLTDFGKVVVGFLFWTFTNYELEPFIELKKLLDKQSAVSPGFDVLYVISVLFDGARLSKVRRQTSPTVDEFYENLGISEIGHAEYSAYAILHGWMENKEEYEIENEFKVNSSQLPQIANELYRLLGVYETLGRKLNYKIDPRFNDFKERVRRGVTEEELPFAKLKQIGRETVRELNRYCRSVLMPSWKYKGTLLEVLKQFHRDFGDEKFLDTHIKYVPNIGEVKGKRILDFIKKSQEQL